MTMTKPSFLNRFQASTFAATVALATTGAFAQTTSDVVFIVDESGSMAGEQTFLQNFIPTLDQNLMTAGVTARYGLVGFGEGGANNLGVIYDVGGGQFGNAAELSTSVAANLDTSGATEDGYSAIDVAARGYTFAPNSSVVMVIVTDEDRDIENAALDATTLQTQLAGINGGATLVGIVSADITGSGMQPAIGTNGTEAFLVDAAGNVTQVPLGDITSSAGTTVDDYIRPAIASSNGCFADLNQLRAGGNAATGFANVFNLCVAQAAAAPVVPITPLTISTPMLSVIRDLGMSFARNRAHAVSLRMDGLDGGGAHRGSGYTPARGEVALDAYGIEGLRVFVTFRAVEGDSDQTTNNASFDYSGYSGTAGIEKSFDLGAASALVGIAGSTGDYSASLGGGLGSANVQSYGGTLYGGIESSNGFYGDTHIGYSVLDIDANRVSQGIAFASDTDGTLLSAGLRIGYDFPPRLANPARGRTFTVGPYASLDYADLDIDGFTEGNNGLVVNDIDSERLDGEIGLRSQFGIEMNGATAFAKAKAGYRHNFLDEEETIGIQSSNGAVTGSQKIDGSDEGVFVLGFGLGAVVTEDLTFAFEYDGQFGDETTEHGVSARIKFAF